MSMAPFSGSPPQTQAPSISLHMRFKNVGIDAHRSPDPHSSSSLQTGRRQPSATKMSLHPPHGAFGFSQPIGVTQSNSAWAGHEGATSVVDSASVVVSGPADVVVVSLPLEDVVVPAVVASEVAVPDALAVKPLDASLSPRSPVHARAARVSPASHRDPRLSPVTRSRIVCLLRGPVKRGRSLRRCGDGPLILLGDGSDLGGASPPEVVVASSAADHSRG